MEKHKLSAGGEEEIITCPKFDIRTVTEGGGEYSMPDYYPPIRKIIGCTADALPDTKFLSGASLEYGGNLIFNVLYIGEDGAVVSLPYTCEYSGSQVLPSEVRGTNEVYVEAAAEDIQYRVLAPRKISLRAKAAVRISADDKRLYRVIQRDGEEKELSAAHKSSLQRLCRTIPSLRRGRGASTESVSGDFRGSAGVKPVFCEGCVFVSSAIPSADTVTVKGEVCLACLVFSPEGAYKTLRARLPFEEIVLCDGARQNDLARAWGKVASISVTAKEGCDISVDAEFDLECEWMRKTEISTVEDCYSTSHNAVAERSSYSSVVPVSCLVAPLSVNGIGRRTTGSREGEYIIYSYAAGKIEKAEVKAGSLVLQGVCTVKAYIAAEGEVICEEAALPIMLETDAVSDEGKGDYIISCSVCSKDLSCRLEGDKLTASAELCISASVLRENEICPVSSISVTDKEGDSARNPEMKIVYPAGNETLWEIGKKYRVSINTLERTNGISRTDHTNNKPVIIPMV